MKTEILCDAYDYDILRAAEIIRCGGLVAFPTETVYGLGANALDGNAVKNIFTAKGRPQDNPLIVHISEFSEASKYVYVNSLAEKIAERFMPGPITVILPKKAKICSEVSCGLDTIGIRIPLYAPARRLIKAAAVPIAAPSANLSGKPSPTKAEHVIDDLNGKIDAVLKGADCQVGVESTVVKIIDENSLVICRPGGITKEMLEEICSNVYIDPAVISKFDGKPVSPGMKYRHYAPKATVTVLIGDEKSFVEFLKDKTEFGVLCFDDDKILCGYENSLTLGSIDNVAQQANRLFDCLRKFDKNENIKNIYARMPDKKGIGLAVYNRLIKAAGFSVVELNHSDA